MPIDSTIGAALIGAVAAVVAALIPLLRRRREPGAGEGDDREAQRATDAGDVRHGQSARSLGSGAAVIQAGHDVVLQWQGEVAGSVDLEVLRHIALSHGQRTSGELLAQEFGRERCGAALPALERFGLIRSFVIDRGKRFTVTDRGRQVLVEQGLL